MVSPWGGKPTWEMSNERRQVVLQAKMVNAYSADTGTIKTKNMANIWIGMTKEFAEKLAIEILRECYKNEHPAAGRLLDLLEQPK